MNAMAKEKRLTPKDIKARRKARGLTQSEAAEKVGVSRRSWAAWEAGETVPSPPLQILIELLFPKKI